MLEPGVVYHVPIQVSGFEGALTGLNNHNSVTFTADELVEAALAVGFNLGTMPAVPMFMAALLRVSALHGLLTTDPTGQYLVRDPSMDLLDASERRVLTYYAGMTLAHAVSAKLLGTLFLAHVDMYAPCLGLTVGTSRPDLIGMTDHGRWIVVEAKGRGSSPSPKDREVAKKQAERFKTQMIGANPPQANVASLSYLTAADRLRMYFIDPPAEDATPILIPTGGIRALHTAQFLPVRQGLLDALDREQTQTVRMTTTGGQTIEYECLNDLFSGLSLGLPRTVVLQPGSEGALGAWTTVSRRGGISGVLDGAFDEDVEQLTWFPQVADEQGRVWTVGPSSIAVRLG